MTGKCKSWFTDLANETPQEKRDWQLLKSKLEHKFGGCLSLAERFQVLQGLQLRAGETTEDFYDRVSADLYTIEQEVLNGATDRKSLIPMHQLFSSLVFISGLDPDLRSALLNGEAARKKTKLATPEEIRMSAKYIQELRPTAPSPAVDRKAFDVTTREEPEEGQDNETSQSNWLVAGKGHSDEAHWSDLGSGLGHQPSPPPPYQE